VAEKLSDSIFTQPLRDRGVRFCELSGNTRNIYKNERMFRKLLSERRYDVAHFNLYQGLSLRYVRLARQAGVPVRIAHSHNTDLRKSFTRPLKLWLHTQAKERYTGDATDLWACSGAAAKFLFSQQELDQKGFQFIPNGIDTERFRFDSNVRETVRKELGLTDKFVVGCVGRLCYQKNQTFLLDVFAELLKTHSKSSLLLVGDGELRGVLEEKARRLGIAGNVLFYGTSDHVEQLMWAMDALAFPSLFEGFGIVAIEAQAAGLPVVCSEHIPEEARLTAAVLPLDAGAPVWGEALYALNGRADRAFGTEQVKQAGFDIFDVAGMIAEVYEKRR
jgi:glycosyltransferase involved in cell wall biosynthesis